jgi:hypothetical protein
MANAEQVSERKTAAIGCIAVLILAAGMTGAIYLVAGQIAELDPKIGAALVAGVFTVLVSVFGNLGVKWFEKREELKAELREKKRPVYEDFVKTVFDRFLNPAALGEQIDESDDEVIRELQKVNTQIMIWGSAEMAKRWGEYRVNASEPSVQNMFVFEDLLKKMREDLGHDDTDLQKGDLLRLFINDIDDYLNDPSD